MHRESLRKKLEQYSPSNLKEITSKKKMLDFLNNNEDCFERSLSIGHFTGSCWIENCDGTKFLLTLHKKIGLWLPLGGHADGDDDIVRVALREAYEESGLQHIELLSDDIFDIGVHLVAPYHGDPAHYHYDVRFLMRASNDNIEISDESDDLRWFTEPPTHETNLGDGVERIFRKWKEMKTPESVRNLV